MSVKIVKTAMLKFLSNPDPSVLCIKGRWGTGKTYAWNEAVKQAATKKEMAKTKYAYLSLFGIKDSSEIFQSIFANTIEFSVLNEGRKLPNKLGGLDLGELYKKVKALPMFASEHAAVPFVAGLAGVAKAVVSNLVYNTVVCIDDLERKSKNVSINEIMGTIAQLRDERKCKVVLILNGNSLDEAELAEFQRYAEKVINNEFQFNPSPTDSSIIAFPGDDLLSQSLREACSALGIINIRVMNRIRNFALELENFLTDVDGWIKLEVLRSLVVLVWSIVSPEGEGAADIDYLVRKREGQYFGRKKVEFTEEEAEWGVLLTRYGFNGCDEFDLLLIDDIQNGFFNEELIRKGVEKNLNDANKARARASIEASWKPFHESFDDNPKEVATSIYDGCIKNIMYLAPMNLDGAVCLLKEIGFPDEAKNLLDQYVIAHDGSFVFNKPRHPFVSSIIDPDVSKAFDDITEENPRLLPTPFEAASRIYKGGWSPEDEETLSNLSTDDFIALFKETKEPDRSVLVLGSLEFRKMTSTSSVQKGITANATAALIRIGEEGPLNANRLKAFGISLPATQGLEVLE